MRVIILIILGCVSLSKALDCVNCGVFLSVASPECRGKPSNTSCAPENIGCLATTGQNMDGTYYVEKRCAQKGEDRDAGCYDVTVRGIQAKQCLCKTDFCNGYFSIFNAPMITALFSLSFFLLYV